MHAIDIARKLQSFHEHWQPRIVAEVNDTEVKLAKIQGTFDWHHHAEEDELFFVLEGQMTMHFRDRDVPLARGQMLVVPRGVEHRPSATTECCIMLIERKGTRNTGNVVNERTVHAPQRI